MISLPQDGILVIKKDEYRFGWMKDKHGFTLSAYKFILKKEDIKEKRGRCPLFSYFNIEFLQEYLKFILCRKAGVYKESAFGVPFLETSVIEKLMVLVYNERDDIVL